MIIAEIGANHNGDINLAKKMIDAAKGCGCDVVKFQSWTYDSLFNKDFKDLEDDARRYSLTEQDFRELFRYCRGIEFLCTPFSRDEVDFLVDMGMKRIKIASMDLNNLEFLEYVAKKGKPIILSTGLGSKTEIIEAVWTIEEHNKDLTILHCVSHYPPDDGNINLNNIVGLQERYPRYTIGFSDHSIGTDIAIAAAALGADVIEKHFTIDRNMEGWDHGISATPEEMAKIVDGVRRVQMARGEYERMLTKTDHKMKPKFRRSAIALRDINKGEVVEREDLTFKRPGTGIPPNMVSHLVGHKARRNIKQGNVIEWRDMYAYWNSPGKNVKREAAGQSAVTTPR